MIWGKNGRGNGWHRIFTSTLNSILAIEGRCLCQVEGYTSYQVLIKSVVMILPLAGPGDCYCAWDLEDLNWYCGLFCGATGRTSGNGRGVLLVTKGRTESNLQLHHSTSELNRPFSLASKILTMKKSLKSFQRDADNSVTFTLFFLQREQIPKSNRSMCIISWPQYL